jgi:hypothetical protein
VVATGRQTEHVTTVALDDLVVEPLAERLLRRERLWEILEALIDQRRVPTDRRVSYATEVRRKAVEADGR